MVDVVSMMNLRFFVIVSCAALLVLGGCTGSAPAVRAAAVTNAAGTTAASPPTFATASSVAIAGVTGPLVGDHWHGAYGIYDCDHYTHPINASAMVDPDGIHGHDDGLIHIHPFTEAVAGAKAVLGLFMSVVGIKLTPSSLDVPALGLLRTNGDACGASKGSVRVVTFSGDRHETITVVDHPESLHLEANMVVAFVFAPPGVPLAPPPSLGVLDSPADAPVELTLTPERRARIGEPPTLIKPTGQTPTSLIMDDLELGTGAVAGPRSQVGVKYTLMGWASGKQIDSNWTSNKLFSFALGAGSVIEGFEKGIVGMKEGGLRKIVVPPAQGYGDNPPSGIDAGDTLVFWVRLVAVGKPVGGSYSDVAA